MTYKKITNRQKTAQLHFIEDHFFFFINSFRCLITSQLLNHLRSFAGEKKEAKAELNVNDFPWLLGKRFVQMDTRPSIAVNILIPYRGEWWQPVIKPFFPLIWRCGWRKEKLLDGWMRISTQQIKLTQPKFWEWREQNRLSVVVLLKDIFHTSPNIIKRNKNKAHAVPTRLIRNINQEMKC